MKTSFSLIPSLLLAFWSCGLCLGFVQAAAAPRPSLHLRPTPTFASNSLTSKTLQLRGGSSSTTQLQAADYSEAAKVLFNNMIGPASMLTGGLVPLGFVIDPPPIDPAKQKLTKRLQKLYQLISLCSLMNELMAIMYATVAVNKLTEVPSAAATSVFALIKRDYELPWIATNIHFMLGLFGFGSMVMLRAFAMYPQTLNSNAAGLALSALVGMTSIINVGVAAGDGKGRSLGGNLFVLGIRYLTLLLKEISEKRYLALISFSMFVVFGIRTIQSLLEDDTDKSEKTSSVPSSKLSGK